MKTPPRSLSASNPKIFIQKRFFQLSLSFWLDVNTDILIKRLSKTKKRPLLYKKNISDTIRKIYLERNKTYKEADFRIKCDLLTSNEIVDKILKLYEKSGN